MISQGKITDPKKKKKAKASSEAEGEVKEKVESDYVISKSGKPVKKPPKGLTFEDLEVGGSKF